MFCPNCGEEVRDDETFCSNCGAGVEEMIAEEVVEAPVAEEVVAELSGEIAEKNLAVTINGAGVISAESKKIYELIENLCSNAVHYNKPNGKIEVLITEDKETVSIKVSDTGIGIEKEHLPRLCERFYRVDKSHSKKTGGTGLGLAIVKHICVLYNAKLSIESDFGLGTSVTVSFHK
jgi:two-component system phosphate regulon sensor histidine kinase PhoR